MPVVMLVVMLKRCVRSGFESMDAFVSAFILARRLLWRDQRMWIVL